VYATNPGLNIYSGCVDGYYLADFQRFLLRPDLSDKIDPLSRPFSHFRGMTFLKRRVGGQAKRNKDQTVKSFAVPP